jgi:hypothetical protein
VFFLNIREKKELELKIINLTDSIIQMVIDSGVLTKEEKEKQYLKGAEIVEVLAEQIVELVGDEKHLENMLKQLTAQKLPDKNILDSFGDFPSDLNKIIKYGLQKYWNKKAKIKQTAQKLNDYNYKTKYVKMGTQLVSKNNTKKGTGKEKKVICNKTSVYGNLKALFPNNKIIYNFPFHGTTLEYYIPEKKLAIEEIKEYSSKRKGKGLKDYWCRKENITLMKVTFHEAKNLSILAKKLQLKK